MFQKRESVRGRGSRTSGFVLLAGLVLALFGLPLWSSPAAAQEQEPAAFRFRPELRLLPIYSVIHEQRPPLLETNLDTSVEASLRLIIEGQPASWFSYEVHGSQDLMIASDEFVHYPSLNEGIGGIRHHNLFTTVCGLIPHGGFDTSMRSLLLCDSGKRRKAW